MYVCVSVSEYGVKQKQSLNIKPNGNEYVKTNKQNHLAKFTAIMTFYNKKEVVHSC